MTPFFTHFRTVVEKNEIGKIVARGLESDKEKAEMVKIVSELVKARLHLKTEEKNFWIAVKGACDLLPEDFSFLFLGVDIVFCQQETKAFRAFTQNLDNTELLFKYASAYMAYSEELLQILEKIEDWHVAKGELI